MAYETVLDVRPLILRRFVWDIFPHDLDMVRTIQGRLGLIPDDDDGFAVEHAASDTRRRRVRPMSEALEILSGYAAEVVSQYAVHVREVYAGTDLPVPEDFYGRFAEQNTPVIYDGVFAILAYLMDSGVLAYGPKVRKEDQDGMAGC